MKLFVLLLTLDVCLLLTITSTAQAKEILLWPGGAPGAEGKTSKEIVRVAEKGEQFLNNINSPSITAYIPKPEQSKGVAIILAPGGGHK